MKAYLKQIRISSKKVNLVAKLVRGKKVDEALTTLKFTPKRAAPVIAKLIASAAANAENNFQQDKSNLIVGQIVVNEGVTLKRGRPVSRGRWHPIKKRTARVSVELTAAGGAKEVKKAAPEKEEQPEPKAEEKKAAPAKIAKAAPKKPAAKKTETESKES